MRLPLRYQILIPLLATVLFTVITSSLVTAWLATRRAERQIDQQLDQIGETLQTSAFPLTDNVLRKMRGLSGAEFLLTDQQGGVISASGEFGDKLRIEGPAQQPTVGFRSPVTLSGAGYFHRIVQITPADRSRPTAQLHMLYPEKEWRAARREAALPPLVVGGISVAVAVALAIAISSRVTQPIGRVRTQLARLAEGSYDELPPPKRNDEVRDLAVSANSLAAQLRQLHEAIRRSERLAILGQLSGGIAHQLRNSVTGARMAIELHQRACRGSGAESLDVAVRQLEMVNEQVVGLLNTGRQDAAPPARLNLADTLADVERLVGPAARHRRVRLQFAAPAVFASGIEDQLRQLILNLVLNAIEAAGRDGRVRVSVDQTPAGPRLRVYDSGPGPSATIAPRMFEPFTTSKPDGIGLGLSVAQRAAREHGGTLEYYRADGETCFELRLPPLAPQRRPAAATARSIAE